MTPGKSSVTVRIAGEDHTIRASAEPEYTRRCAKLVDDRIHDIRVTAGLIEGHKAAILAALSIADELFQAQDQRDGSIGEIAQRLDRLAAKVERALPPE
ncbi:cell division protein ZapA [Gemmatimonadales bacterium]|nr:cell division protein ZapA [Gemmatimonadales bacterium]